MNVRDMQRAEISSEHERNNSRICSTDEAKEKGSTEIISKYNNYHITEIVTDLRRNEVTEIGKISKETLQNIIGGYVLVKRTELTEKNTITLQERKNCTAETSHNIEDSNTSVDDIEIPRSHRCTELWNGTREKCYVRMEFDENIESLQNESKKNSEMQKRKSQKNSELVVYHNNNNGESKSIPIMKHHKDRNISDFVKPVEKIECASHKEVFEQMKEICSKKCYVKIIIDQAIENMQNKMKELSETQNENSNTFESLNRTCDGVRGSEKIVSINDTNKFSTSNSANRGRKRKKSTENEDQDISPINCRINLHSRCEHVNLENEIYERENNILIYENLRIENSLIKAKSRIQLLETELKNLKKINNYAFLEKYFEEEEITALIENSKIDWCNKMITKALQLRFACGNGGYEELLKNVHLPSLRTLRHRVHDSQFDLAQLARDMIYF